MKTIVIGLFVLGLWILGGCSIPQVSAEERLFLDLSVTPVADTVLPMQDIAGTTLGGLSAISYDANTANLYALSDDKQAPHFYTLRIGQPPLSDITVETVTFLKDADGNPYPAGVLDPEGMALSPRGTLIVSSEGPAPSLGEYDLTSGQLKTQFRLPERYLKDPDKNQGIQTNLSLESLTLNTSSTSNYGEPFRLFVANEGPLLQDLDDAPDIAGKNRFLHYLIGEGTSTLLSEHWYPMDLSPTGAVLNGLSELLLLDQGGHFLGIERAFGLQGFGIKLYQLASGGATDISAIATLKGDISGLNPIAKQLVADFATLGLPLENYEGITFGPRLSDGHPSLLLISDNNFDTRQKTQLLLLRLDGLD
jgi:hypothetical protein